MNSGQQTVMRGSDEDRGTLQPAKSLASSLVRLPKMMTRTEKKAGRAILWCSCSICMTRLVSTTEAIFGDTILNHHTKHTTIFSGCCIETATLHRPASSPHLQKLVLLEGDHTLLYLSHLSHRGIHHLVHPGPSLHLAVLLQTFPSQLEPCTQNGGWKWFAEHGGLDWETLVAQWN